MADLPTTLQILQGLGAGVGLVTGVFYFGERLIRHYPTAFVVVRPLMPGGAHKEPFLRVQNHATRPILISWRSGSQDNRFKIAKGSTTLDYIATTRDGEQWFLLDAGEVVELVLHRPPNYESLSAEGEAFTEVAWRFAQPTCYKRSRKLAVRILKRDLEIMMKGEAPSVADHV